MMSKAPNKIYAGPLDDQGDIKTPFCDCRLRPYLDYIEYTKTSDITTKIGKYTISRGTKPGRIWIEQEGGEGGDFSEKLLAIWLEIFYDKNF